MPRALVNQQVNLRDLRLLELQNEIEISYFVFKLGSWSSFLVSFLFSILLLLLLVLKKVVIN